MRRLVTLFAALGVLLWLPLLAGAQAGQEGGQDDRGYLQAYLEDSLSGAGRKVRITGFAGALSARATIEELTIADDEGVWLTLRGAVLDWNRSALLLGRLEINELSASEILIPRQPNMPESIPDPEAAGFSLPQLPVSIDIASIKAARVVLGETLLGEAAEVRLQGAASLAEGAGRTDLLIERIDDAVGKLNLLGSYSNETRKLALSLSLSEAEGGIAAKLAGLPGHPAVDLHIKGAGLVDDFAADITLATDGVKRLEGRVVLARVAAQDAATELGQNTFTADIGGDIAPLFLPDYRLFFGKDIRLTLSGSRFDTGRVQVDELDLTTDAMQLAGQLALAPDGWPERFALTGRIAAKAGDTVLLPLAGPKTRIKSAELSLNYDAASGDEWSAAFVIEALQREDVTLDAARLTGLGGIVQSDGASVGRVSGEVTLDLMGIAATNQDLATAIGPSLAGGLTFDWTEDAPLSLSALSLSGADYGLTGSGTLAGLRDRLNLTAQTKAKLTAKDVSRFSGLAGVPLSGAATLAVDGTVALLGGAFDLRLAGTGSGLGIGQPRIDPLLAGASTLTLITRRDETGTIIEQFDIASDHADINASAELKTGASAVRLRARINDAALVAPGLNGAATLNGTAQQTGTDWRVDMDATAPGGTVAQVRGTVPVTQGEVGRAAGNVTLRADSLAPFARLTGQRLSGAVDLTVQGWIDPANMHFDATISGTGQNLGTGQPQLDLLLRGQSTLAVAAHRDDADIVTLKTLRLVTPEVTALVSGTTGPGDVALRFNTSLRDLAIFAPGVTGAASINGTAKLSGQSWQIAAQGTGPGGAAAQVSGRVGADGGNANLAVTGTVPLALANPFIKPNRVSGQAGFELSMAGPMALSSLSGTVRTDTARVAIPTPGLTFEPLSAVVRLSGGRAVLEGRSPVSTGGHVSLSGPISLSPPYDTDLTLRLAHMGLTDNVLYQTTVDGSATVKGALSGSARIGADLTLGETELRVPENGFGNTPVLSGLRHRNEPADVRLTRERAGLLARDHRQTSGATAYPLDIMLRAPARIFVRGRGLDAELGGQIHLTGTTADVVPQGRFDLIRGRLDILGKRLMLSEGFARLQGGFDPYLWLVAETKAAEIDIQIVLEGLASAPSVTFASRPELPEDEVLARLLFGRDLTKISPLQALQLASAVNTLAGGGGAGIVNSLRENFGLDDLDITTGEGGATGARIGKYITKNIYSDITVGSDGNSEINLNITVTPSLTARGSLGSDGESSLGVFFERDY